jgi:glycogen debranching enzyme
MADRGTIDAVVAGECVSEHVELIGWTRGEPMDALLTREWLVTNGIGGYATGSIAGAATRRYHGLLVAALPVPLGRTVMLNHLEESIVAGNATLYLSGDEPSAGAVRLPDVGLLADFRLELGLPVWRFENHDVRITRRLLMPHLQNTSCITYTLDAASSPVRLRLRPSVHFRPHEQDVATPLGHSYAAVVEGARFTISEEGGVHPLRLDVRGGEVTFNGRRGAHGDRRLSLVHRLGPRHDDQPRRADARTGRTRGRLHPAHVRALRARRPDPEHVPRGRERRAVSHRRRDAVVLPRVERYSRRPATTRRCASCCRR